MGVLAQRQERRLGAVADGGQTVGTEADPGQEGDQGDVVPAGFRVERVAGFADDRFLDFINERHGGVLVAFFLMPT